ncbi:MAG: hypothetical protein ABWY71_02100 [Candidatus Saccharimonadales bacterium]
MAYADDPPTLHFHFLNGNSKTDVLNSKLKVTLGSTVSVDETIIVTAAVGPVAGNVHCSDTQGNTYAVSVNKTTSTDRLFMCVAAVTHQLNTGDKIKINYPTFDGLSIASVEQVHALDVPGAVDTTAKGAGKKIAVDATPVTPSASRALLFGTILTHGEANVFTTPGTEEYQAYSTYGAGTGSDTKLLTAYYYTSGDPVFSAPYILDGSQSFAGPWATVQAVFLATQSVGSGADQ